MNSIGEALRRERLRRNLDLEQVARETKISVKLLEAIEAEDFSKLPGGVFAKSFVRQYARLLGLDEDEIVAELQRSIQPPTPDLETPETAVPTPPAIELPRVPDWGYTKSSRSNSALPALAGVVVVMLICSGVYAWWQRSHRPEAAAPQAGTTAQANPPEAAPQPAPLESPQVATTRQEPAPALPPAASTPGQQPQTAAEQQPPAGPTAQGQPDTGPTSGSFHVMITAQEPTWVSARSDGKMVYSGTLQPNEKRDLAAADQVRLVVGNAGGINIELNGKPVPPLGPRGQVRVVQFSPGGVQIVPPPKPLAPGAL